MFSVAPVSTSPTVTTIFDASLPCASDKLGAFGITLAVMVYELVPAEFVAVTLNPYSPDAVGVNVNYPLPSTAYVPAPAPPLVHDAKYPGIGLPLAAWMFVTVTPFVVHTVTEFVENDGAVPPPPDVVQTMEILSQ